MSAPRLYPLAALPDGTEFTCPTGGAVTGGILLRIIPGGDAKVQIGNSRVEYWSSQSLVHPGRRSVTPTAEHPTAPRGAGATIMTENTTITTKATKASKSAAAKASSNGKAPAEKKDGLRAPQVRVLAYLAKAKEAATRKEIAEKSPADLAMLNSYIGSHDADRRAANDAKNFPCLLTLGYVKAQVIEERGTCYVITASGRKALEKAEKAAK